MVTLYDYLPSGNGYKVRLVLTQLGIPFERIETDIIKGATRSPEFLCKFPNGRVPAVELDDGRRLFESNAIISFFAEGTRLMPSGRFERAQALQWMFFEQYSHEPYIAATRYLVIHAQVQDERRALLSWMRKRGYDALGVMEAHLEQHDFFVAETYSVADIALYAYTHVAGEGGFDLTRFPAARRWLDRVRSQPKHIAITQS
jgi:glutathione S-transferase